MVSPYVDVTVGFAVGSKVGVLDEGKGVGSKLGVFDDGRGVGSLLGLGVSVGAEDGWMNLVGG